MHWGEALKGYTKRQILIFLFLGFACGLPYNLLWYSLSAWLRDMEVALPVVGLFGLALLPYNFKFLWAPFIDRVKLPVLSDKFGQKKSWALVFQVGLIASIFCLATTSPNDNHWIIPWEFQTDAETLVAGIPMETFIWATLTAFFACSQDIVVDALRIDTLTEAEMGEGAGTYQMGYRLGMLLSGAGVVGSAAYLSWQLAYIIVGLCVFAGMISLFFVKEPVNHTTETPTLKGLVVKPFVDFASRHPRWIAFLVFIVLYKLCNSVLGRMALPFYMDIGFTKQQIALISGTFGPFVTMLGIPIGGILVARFGAMRSLFYLGFVEIATSVAFAGLACLGTNLPVFFAVIAFDNIVGGMGGAVFVAFLSGLCSRAYSATQYALLSSLMAVSSSVIASFSGVWAQNMGWIKFFLFTGVLMVPALLLLKSMIYWNKQEN